jgi:hypothetical protein
MRQFLGPRIPRVLNARSLSSGPRQLAGRNIFQLRAQAAAQETAPAPAKGGGKQQEQQPVDLASIPLPTSDEDEKMLRIRHSVSGCGAGPARIRATMTMGSEESELAVGPAVLAECAHDGHGSAEAVQGRPGHHWALD